jgi:phosphatidate cytidylyltransferase
MQRLASAAIMASIVWVAIKIAPLWVFYLLAFLFISGACLEMYRMLGKYGAPPFRWLGLAASCGLVWSMLRQPPIIEPCLPLIAVTTLTVVMAIWLRKDAAEMLGTALNTLFPVIFVGLALGFLLKIRNIPGDDGEDLLLLVLVCVIFSDAAAYYVGSNIGKHRLAPRLSPNKSWEGAVGGMLASIGGAVLAHFWFFQRLPLGHAIVIGLILGVVAILGDLAESLIKRAAGVKDSSNLIPGHGGLLDRSDSLLFAGPVLFYYYLLFLKGIW